MVATQQSYTVVVIEFVQTESQKYTLYSAKTLGAIEPVDVCSITGVLCSLCVMELRNTCKHQPKDELPIECASLHIVFQNMADFHA